MISDQYKGNNSSTTKAVLTKLDVHQRIIVIYIHIKFHQNPLIGYLVMATDGRDGQEENYVRPPSAGDKKEKKSLEIIRLEHHLCIGSLIAVLGIYRIRFVIL